jgi:CRP-like cAMP-binding protein
VISRREVISRRQLGDVSSVHPKGNDGGGPALPSRTSSTRCTMVEIPSPLSRKLAHFVALSTIEITLLEDLQSARHPVLRHREIVTKGIRYDGLFVLIEGFAIRYQILHDGRRQVFNIALPGDFIGFPACFFESALYSVVAITDTVIAPIPYTRLLGLLDAHPRLAAKIFWSFACEAAMYTEHLINVGRRSALERVAHFLLELLVRLQIVGLADEYSYPMPPLTQQLMADALGLSIPHVNRTIRQLRQDQLVGIEDHRVTIKDTKGLSLLAGSENGYSNPFHIPELHKRCESAPQADALLGGLRSATREKVQNQ